MEVDERWGGAVRFDTGGPEYMGWIIAARVFADKRNLEVLTDDPTHIVYIAEKRALSKPYRVAVIELHSRVYELDIYETNEDFRRKDFSYFETAEAAIEYLATLEVRYEDLRPIREVDAPWP